MTLDELNDMPAARAVSELLACCGSREWATQLIQQRPFANTEALLDAADRTWLKLGEVDWLEAFAAHPRIGQKTDSAVAKQEQASALSASEQIKRSLAQGNKAYEEKFGFIFIVFASGKSADEMLELLRVRLGNDRSTEIRKAAGEQMKITRLRLQKLLGLENLKT